MTTTQSRTIRMAFPNDMPECCKETERKIETYSKCTVGFSCGKCRKFWTLQVKEEWVLTGKLNTDGTTTPIGVEKGV